MFTTVRTAADIGPKISISSMRRGPSRLCVCIALAVALWTLMLSVFFWLSLQLTHSYTEAPAFAQSILTGNLQFLVQKQQELTLLHVGLWLAGLLGLICSGCIIAKGARNNDAAQSTLGGLSAELKQQALMRTKDMRQRRRELQTFMDNTEAGMYLKNTRHEFVLANKFLLELLEVSAERLIGKQDRDFIDAEVSRKIRACEERAMNTMSSIRFELDITVHGELRHYTAIAFPFFSSTKVLEGIGGTLMADTRQQPLQENLPASRIPFADMTTPSPGGHYLSKPLLLRDLRQNINKAAKEVPERKKNSSGTTNKENTCPQTPDKQSATRPVMQKDNLPSGVLDRASMRNSFGNDRELAHLSIRIFLRDAPALAQSIALSIATENNIALTTAARLLKGLVGHYTCAALYTACQNLENIGHKRALPEQKSAAAALMVELEDLLRACTLDMHYYLVEG